MSRASLAAGSGPAAGLGIPPALSTPVFLGPLGDAAGLAEVSLRRQEARASRASLLAVPDRHSVHLSVREVGARRHSNAGCARGYEHQVCIVYVRGGREHSPSSFPHEIIFWLGMSGRELNPGRSWWWLPAQHVPGTAEVQGQWDDSGCRWQAAATLLCP